jgi:hypothetical protein
MQVSHLLCQFLHAHWVGPQSYIRQQLKIRRERAGRMQWTHCIAQMVGDNRWLAGVEFPV